MEEVHHIRMKKSYSPNIPDSHSDQEIGKTDIDMNKIYTSMNKAEIHHQSGESQVIGRSSDVTSIQVEVSHKVRRQTSNDVEMPSIQKREESSRSSSNPNDKLIYEKEIGSSY